jgi:hypothetical protein
MRHNAGNSHLMLTLVPLSLRNRKGQLWVCRIMWFPPPTSGRNHCDATADQEDVLTGRDDAVVLTGAIPIRCGTTQAIPI